MIQFNITKTLTRGQYFDDISFQEAQLIWIPIGFKIWGENIG